jgi:hypothetical protein
VVSPASSLVRQQAAIEADRARIAGGARPTYHVRWATALDGSIDVTVAELPLIHQFVPSAADVLDGARFLIARTLDVDAAAFEVAPAADRGAGSGP